MHKAYADLVRARSAAAIAEAAALREVQHQGLLGSLRETVLRQLLSPLLPVTMGVGTGVVIGHDGTQSSQIDIVIYDRTLLPPLLLQEAGLIPIEAALALIEVKSTLNMAGLRQAHAMSVEIGGIPMLSGEFTPDDAPLAHGPLHPTCGVFAFSSDLKPGADEYARYEEMLAGSRAALRHICVAGRSYYWARSASIDPSTPPPPPGAPPPMEWIRWAENEAHDEVLGFLSVLLNTLPVISRSRGMPRIGRYLSVE